MDSVTPAPELSAFPHARSAFHATSAFRAGPAAQDSRITGIGEVILAEHARILRLFGSLDNIARRADHTMVRLMLSQVWTRLAGLLERHLEAEEEICFPALFCRGAHALALVEDAIADHGDVRETVAEARLLDVGSARWWRAVTAGRRACAEHFAREEQALLAKVHRCVPPETSKILARQWAMFGVQADEASDRGSSLPPTTGRRAGPGQGPESAVRRDGPG